MIRLFVESDLKEKQVIELSVFQTHYLCHVMRLKEGDEVACFNGSQGEGLGKLSHQKKKVYIQIQKQIRKQKNLPECILCPALIKKEAMDFVWQKATELGVTKIYPILADRSVMKTFNKTHALSVVREACEQCERMDVPEIVGLDNLEDTIQKLKGKVRLIWLSERGGDSLDHFDFVPAFFVGPEGGWSEKEKKLLKSKADDEWHLGQTILRAETACLSALAIYQSKKK